MAYKLDPQIEAALAGFQSDKSVVQVPRGDWQQLRQTADAVFAAAEAALVMPEGVTVEHRSTQTSTGRTVNMRWYQRQESLPGSAILYVHGGGMIAGSAKGYDGVLAPYVAATGVPMLSVDYGLAPEHSYPAPLDDCLSALIWLLDNASDLGVDSARIAVMGDSAGGGLAAGLAALARDNDISLARQILIYPMLDDRRTEADPAIAPYVTWTADNNWTGWHALLGNCVGGDNVPPLAAPARLENLLGLPATYIEVGDLDIFRDECITFALNLSRAGVPMELHVHSGAPHGFEYCAPNSDVTARAFADRIRVISQI